MDEYIEREKVLKILEDMRMDYENSDDPIHTLCEDYADALETAENKLNMLIAADVRPERHSHWHGYESCVFMGRYGKDGEPIFQDRKTFMCVKCGRNTIIKETFCPSCGAKMDRKDDKK